MFRRLVPFLKKCKINVVLSKCDVHTGPALCKDRWNYKSLPKPDEGTEGERVIGIDTFLDRKALMFPDATSHLRIFNGIPYENIHICNIKATPNNTILNVTDDKGKIQFVHTCGMEGFKNTRRGTNIAAQATAVNVGIKALDRGIKQVRVRVQGLGAGRMSAIKGLQMGGLQIVSVTDNTKVSWNPPRPRKAKRL